MPDRWGKGGLKILIFAGRPKWMAPYSIPFFLVLVSFTFCLTHPVTAAHHYEPQSSCCIFTALTSTSFTGACCYERITIDDVEASMKYPTPVVVFVVVVVAAAA